MKIVVAGGTGFVGKNLVSRLLAEGHEVTLLTRSPRTSLPLIPKLTPTLWDAQNQGAWADRISQSDAVINLAGEGIAEKRWSVSQKQKILTSRVYATQALVRAIHAANPKPQILINASAIGYYGHVPEDEVVEHFPSGQGFLPEVCRAWEQEAFQAQTLGLRTVVLRIGIVLAKEGGALSKMLLPFQLFAGGPLGNGKQWLSWIHREDVIRIILFVLNQPRLSGPVNVTAPHPLRMTDFCRVLGKVLHRPSYLPAPGFALNLLLGEMSALLLEGQKVLPKKLLYAGFQFKYPELEQALRSILNSR